MPAQWSVQGLQVAEPALAAATNRGLGYGVSEQSFFRNPRSLRKFAKSARH